MPLQEFIFEKKISLGSVLEIVILCGSIIWATAFIKADVDTTKKEQTELRVEFKAHEVVSREQARLIDQTYVRKDVLDQVMKRLDDIQNSLNRLDQKVTR